MWQFLKGKNEGEEMTDEASNLYDAWFETIKPCPLCGTDIDNGLDCWSENREWKESNYPDEACCFRLVIRCSECDCELAGEWVPGCGHINSVKKLVQNWNKRTGGEKQTLDGPARSE